MWVPHINPMKYSEEEDVERWIVNFCTNHLEQNLGEAADQFLKSHKDFR
jgi:hypothetical protein